MKDLRVPGGDGSAIAVTISAGVAQLRPGESIDGLIARADEALYRAKGTGRDRVATSGENETP
jgi:PleD family two-component response regulator